MIKPLLPRRECYEASTLGVKDGMRGVDVQAARRCVHIAYPRKVGACPTSVSVCCLWFPLTLALPHWGIEDAFRRRWSGSERSRPRSVDGRSQHSKAVSRIIDVKARQAIHVGYHSCVRVPAPPTAVVHCLGESSMFLIRTDVRLNGTSSNHDPRCAPHQMRLKGGVSSM